MAAPKCRIDVWQPTILNVLTTGATTTAQRPPMWVKCDTVTDVTTEDPPGPNPNLRRANACTSVEIKDEMFTPRIAYISVANRPQDFRAYDDETLETQYQDSDGNSIALTAGGSAVKTRIRRNWGPFSHFFKEFQQIRIVDLETHMVLFTGRVYKVSKKHDGQRGATVELVCKDALEELRNISMRTLPKELHFPANTYRSTVIQSLLNLGFNYEASLPAGGIKQIQTSPVTTPLATGNVASDDSNTSTTAGASGDVANSYSRFERSMTKSAPITKLKSYKTGSKNILSELSRWAILEPHEDETAENQFGYDFFVDSNIGSTNLLATTAPPPAMFNYFKRGNRLSAAGSAGQDADTYGLTCILPTVARATHTGLRQQNVGTTAESGNTSVTTFAVSSSHSLYPGQVITIGSEQMLVIFAINGADEGGNNEVNVVRGWRGSEKASFSSSATILENRPASAIMQKDTSSFDDAKDELFTECDLIYDTSYFIGSKKFGTREKTKKFEIMFATEISDDFTWSGLDFDDDSAPSDADTPGTDSVEFVSAYREDGSTLLTNGATVARIQYQSTSTVTGATNFGYIMLSDITVNFPTENYSGQDYIVLKGNTSNETCRVNLNSTEVQTGRPATALAAGTTRFRRGFTMTKETHDNIDDIRQEIAARLGQSTIAMTRGDFTVSKAPYYWADFKVRSVSADGSTGQILTVKSDNGTAAVKVTNYGFREGMLVHQRSADYSTIETANNNDVYGYCYSMTADDTFRVNLTESQSFAVDDKIRLHIPIRAGDAMFIDHILATVYGEHLTTAVNFSEMPAPTTSYSTIGENETRIRIRVGAVNRQNIWNTIAVDRLEANERERNNLPKGTQTFSFSGTWSYPANNVVRWTAGNFRTSDGEVYQIAADDTSDVTNSGTITYGLGSSGMTGSNKYTVYLDPAGENPSGNIFHFYTKLSSSYVEDDDNVIILEASRGVVAGKGNAVAGANMDLTKTDTPQSEAFKLAHDGSISEDLIVDGAITADKINTNAITADKILAGEIAVAKLTSAAQTTITEKTISTVASSAPSNPRNNDIWFDTSGSPTIIKVYDTSVNPDAWVERNANAPEGGGGATVFRAATVSIPTSNAVGDLWYDSTTQIVYVAVTHPASTIQTSTQWVKQNAALAINSGATAIDGGLINTRMIILTGAGSGGNILQTDTGSSTAPRIELDNTSIRGYSDSSTVQFQITAATGKAVFGADSCTLETGGIKIGSTSGAAGGAKFEIGAYSGGSDKTVMFMYGGALYFDVSTSSPKTLTPTNDNTLNLGASGTQFKELFIVTVTESSDARIKKDIKDLSNSDSLQFINSLQPRSFQRIDDAPGEEKLRYGLIAQEVEEALTGLGIDKHTWSGINIPETETLDTEDRHTGEAITINTNRGLSYTAFIAPLIGAVKELKARIEVLEGNG